MEEKKVLTSKDTAPEEEKEILTVEKLEQINGGENQDSNDPHKRLVPIP